MAAGKRKSGKLIALAALGAVCALLVYRNLILPSRQPSAPAPAIPIAGRQANTARQRELPTRLSSSDPARREKSMDQQELAALDPTLRFDLLEKTAQIKYEAGGRNIFQFYTPPPKPVAPPIVGPQAPAQPVAPPPPSIPLKFYGISTRPGSPEKRAFLTDGEEIFIAKEGDVIDKHFKIARIGVNSLDWEDTQNKQHGQLPLLVE